MENLKRILARYAGDERIKLIAGYLGRSENPRIYARGLVGASDSFVLSGLFSHGYQSHLCIAPDKEAAAYLENALSNIMDKYKVHLFTDSFKRPLLFDEMLASNVLTRTEAVNDVSHPLQKYSLIVTYPEALIEKVVAPAALRKKQILIRKEEVIDLDDLIMKFVDFGFERVDFVYEPGQFSIRGGIIDLFTFGNAWPYRIELFDDEVESIRTFDPLTQLSRKKIQSISIIPNVNTKYSDAMVSLLRVIPAKTMIWIQDFQHLLDQLQNAFETLESVQLKDLNPEDEKLQMFFKHKPVLYPREVMDDLAAFPIILKNAPVFQPDHIVDFGMKPQPSFNKNFKLLIDNLKGNSAKGLENYLFTDNVKQIERFYNIFEDLEANVRFHPVPTAIHEGFIDPGAGMACYTDHQIFERFHRYQLRRGFTRERALNLRMLRELVPGDYVTHIDHGIGKYSGLEKIDINGHIQESVRLIYKNNDILYVSINSLHKISKYVGKDGTAPQLNKLGGDAWTNLKRKTKRKVKDIAKDLIKLYAKRRAAEGFAYPVDGYMQNELEASFIYEDTPDQYKATQDTKEDMIKAHPMDRLICGDVGFGKTEVAVRAAFKAVLGGKQVAVLVPTTILALQHYRTFKERLGDFSVDIDYINRFRTTKERKAIIEKLKHGKLDIVIGTHGLLNRKIKFRDLGLLVVDEEQKFGVSAKERLRQLKVNVDTLTLTATPIPRTLQFSLMGVRDLSIIRTPPPNRQPIHTERRIFDHALIKDAINYEINRGGQVFFVHNRVKSLPDVRAMVQRINPEVDVAMAHGQMEARTLEETLVHFIDRKFDVLVCTNIIETGLDIPNANTIIINNAHQFGLSDLHQLRGRVGRSNKKAFCYLFAPPLSALTPEARKRLRTVEEFSDLGSGFDIAMRDMDIRGAGNLLGAEQSGFISDIGYETYQKILEESVQELKETEFRDLFEEELASRQIFVRDVQIETDVEMLIPDEYVNNINERLRLYTELDQLDTEDDIATFSDALADRFGPIPDVVIELFEGLRIRWLCKELGFDRMILKNEKLRCFFVRNAQSPFYETAYFQQFLNFMATRGQEFDLTLKQSRKNLLIAKDHVATLKKARQILKMLSEEVMASIESVSESA